MKKILLTAFSITAMMTASALATNWSYEGETGADKWASLDPDYQTCASNQQSPIDISGGVKAALPKMTITQGYLTGTFESKDNSLQLTAGLDVPALEIDDKPYNLVQFHFHGSSEHAIDGVKSPMEIQYVYQHESGDLAVIAIMVEEGAENPELAKLFASLPAGTDSADVRNIDMSALMPDDMNSYFRYQGSLATPPCSENVSWTVMKNPINASKSQIDTFAGFFPNNARPLQSLNRRYILQSF